MTDAIRIRAPKRFYAGLVLIGICLFVFWANHGMTLGTPRMMGPAMFPRILAVMIGISGAVLVLLSLNFDGEKLERFSIRGPFFVTLSIIAFSLTIRSMGMAVAGMLALTLSGFATPEARPREVLIFAAVMTVLSILLFHYFLGMSVKILDIPGTGIEF
ncbi:tripartite tricarboxylate transporter TctB family protein [Chelativorans salis]|uniref:Tripartite tricarboxylate transporter TctB family protein n=1 Tax=Chelativorans salis TaxID=2978478 RepID=A0ABT2LUB7_9HYPH|nr:tripartite tricarboxylate transporter TctB family protein [Chelativorans sp. EGI FJ00035]MCT7378131.1 tripartite tricarboxylate transporter TctB family protein [Chelativorans sp. EGI FJ00035]